MGTIPIPMYRLVVERARNHCEYCRLPQEGQEARFHIDHVVPRAEGGPTSLENLALACVSCSLRKGARLTGTDPQTGTDVALFNPRFECWEEHFVWQGLQVVGLTPAGRATVEALRMNRSVVLGIREEQRLRGRHPPHPHIGDGSAET